MTLATLQRWRDGGWDNVCTGGPPDDLVQYAGAQGGHVRVVDDGGRVLLQRVEIRVTTHAGEFQEFGEIVGRPAVAPDTMRQPARFEYREPGAECWTEGYAWNVSVEFEAPDKRVQRWLDRRVIEERWELRQRELLHEMHTDTRPRRGPGGYPRLSYLLQQHVDGERLVGPMLTREIMGRRVVYPVLGGVA